MKKNKINPIEAHFEKLVLVAVSGVLLAVVAMQFLTQPNAVPVGNSSTPMAPDRVFVPLEAEAEDLLAKMRNTAPTLPEVPQQDVAGQFAAVSDLAIADSIRVTMLGDGVDISEREIGPGGSDAATTYAMPELPVPVTVTAATHRATIDPYAAVTNEALRDVLPAEQPFDKVAVSVEGLISGAMLLASLEADPDGDAGPLRPLPLQWWRGNIELLGVEVEREEMSETGSWGSTTVMSGVPGRDTVLADARQQGITPAELVQVAQSAQSVMRDIAQPTFPDTIAGPDWIRPSEMDFDVEMTDEERTIARLKRQYESLGKRRDGLQLQLENVGAGGSQTEERGGGGRREGGGGGGQPRQPVDRTQQQRDRLTAQIAAVEEQMQRIADELADLGAPIDADPNASQDNQPEPPLPSLLAAEDLPVWVHDLTAEPGKTYRYRMRVVVNNPLFAKEQYLSDSQKAVAASPTAEGAWSGWSRPVDVERDRHFFVVSGSETDQIGNGPRAAVEVYQFYYGYWRKGSTTLEPGDSIHARAKLPDNLLLWDLDKLAASGPQAGVRDPRNVDRGPEGGGERFVNPDRGGDPRDPGNRNRDRNPGRNTDTGEFEVPEGAEKAPEMLDLTLAAMLLDVATEPGEDNIVRVVLRGQDGRVLTRLTSDDRSSQLYKRLSINAREGENQGQPEPDPNENRQTLPDLRENDFREEGGGSRPGG